MLWSSSAPILFSIFLTFFSHMTLCHLISHLTLVTWPDDYLTFQSHDHPYCSHFLLSYSPLSAIYGDLIVSGPIVLLPIVLSCYCLCLHCPRALLFISLGHLVMVAASVVYKPSLYHRRGLKPDLVSQSKCCCSYQSCVLPSFLSISSLFGLSQDPLKLSLVTLPFSQDICLVELHLKAPPVVTKGASPL